jgi:hypothetical protein
MASFSEIILAAINQSICIVISIQKIFINSAMNLETILRGAANPK